LGVFDNKVLRRISGPKPDEQGWRKLHSELHKTIRWAGQEARMGKIINAYDTFVGKLEEITGRLRHICEDDIKMNSDIS
jgi:hypothetical protein